MSPIFKAITVGATLAILLIAIIHPQYIEYGYGLIIINILSVFTFSWLDQKNHKQTQVENQEFIANHNNKMQIIIENIRSEINASAVGKMELDKKILYQQELAITQLQKHSVQVAEVLEEKVLDLSNKIIELNSKQVKSAIIQQKHFVNSYTHAMQTLTEQVAEQNKYSYESMDEHLRKITEKFTPIFELVSNIKDQIKGNNDYMLERVSIMKEGQESLQTILSENGKQFTKVISESLSDFTEKFEDLLEHLSDEQKRQADELNITIKRSQNKQSENLQELTEDFRLVAQSQKDTQEIVQKSLQLMSEFNEELCELNQKDLTLLESMLNG